MTTLNELRTLYLRHLVNAWHLEGVQPRLVFSPHLVKFTETRRDKANKGRAWRTARKLLQKDWERNHAPFYSVRKAARLKGRNVWRLTRLELPKEARQCEL